MDEHSGTLRTESHFIIVRAKRFGRTVGHLIQLVGPVAAFRAKTLIDARCLSVFLFNRLTMYLYRWATPKKT